MKALIILIIVASYSVSAQTKLEKMGLVIGGKPKEKSVVEAATEKNRASRLAAERNRATLVSPGDYRVVDGQLYNASASELWEFVPGKYNMMKVEQVGGLGVVCDVETRNLQTRDLMHLHYVIIKNHPLEKSLVSGVHLEQVRAMKTGRAQFGGDTVAVYDFGIVTNAPGVQITAAEITARNAAAAEKRVAQRAAELKFHQELAAKGDAYGQFRMGERYLKGLGVEEDLEKAREYFLKSAAQGNESAKLALERLPSKPASN